MQKMTVSEAVNRGINFFAVSMLGITGLGVLLEFSEEEDTIYNLEDSFFVSETLFAIIWYKYSGKALKRTLIPFYFLLAGFVIKSIGLYIKRDDPIGSISDFIYFGILGITIIIFLYQYFKFREGTPDAKKRKHSFI